MVLRLVSLIVAIFFSFSIANGKEDSFPFLDSLDSGDGVRESGKRLVDLPFGLHLLEKPNSNESEMIVGVHGMRSRGYEWVYPLQTMDSDSRLTYFFNWDAQSLRCIAPVAMELHEAILNEVKESQASTVIVVGHSLGGLVVSQLADQWQEKFKLDIHTIASPLAGLENQEEADCAQKLPTNKNAQVRFFQWRTQFELDNAFNRMEFNPMEVEISNSVVVTLPDIYRESRLGHNWSVSYVAERIAEQ